MRNKTERKGLKEKTTSKFQNERVYVYNVYYLIPKSNSKLFISSRFSRNIDALIGFL